MTSGRRVAAALGAVVLGVLAGAGLWVRFVYDETPGSHRVAIVTTRGNEGVVAFTIDRYANSPVPVSDVITSGDWRERPPGTLRTRSAGAVAIYEGAVDETVTIRLVTGPSGGEARRPRR